jgi:F-type H+-transporting ATPase subunit delta
VPATASAKRYASAAFSVARETGEYDAWLATLEELARILQMPSARTIFISPAVPTAEKRSALDRLLPNASPVIRNFLHILADRDRLGEVPSIAAWLRELVNRQRGITIADVTSAVALDVDMQRLVADRLAAYLNRDPKKISIRTRVDPALIGGVVARVGDRLIDDSVRGRLERLRRALSGSTR